MIGAVIVTHGMLARELLGAAERIVGPTHNIRAITLDWEDEVADAKAQVAEAIAAVEDGSGVLVFTEIFGGTPTNVSLTFLEHDKVEVVAGVNLPMLVKLTSLQGADVSLLEVARQIRDRGQKSVYVASDLLSSQDKK